MTPRHRPPFGLDRVLYALLDLGGRTGVADVEDAFSVALDVPHAVLLPSARAGICWALNAALEAEAHVLCPAFTCAVVHEAAIRTGRPVEFLDAVVDGFLMDPAAIHGQAKSSYGIILCELFGHQYDLNALSHQVQKPPALRIIDMAMTVPDRALIGRLQGNDFGVLSFGIGKCMYAGWGGMGLTQDATLATEVRKIRDDVVVQNAPWLRLRRAAAILMRTAAHDPQVYGTLRVLRDRSYRRTSTQSVHREAEVTNQWRDPSSISPEWFLPSTPLDRKLALYNLQVLLPRSSRKMVLAARYRQNLQETEHIALPPPADAALSHYTVRLPAAMRAIVRRSLWRKNIDGGVLFGFPGHLNPKEFPNAHRTASEVLNLPVNYNMSLSDVDRTCRHLVRCVTEADRRLHSEREGQEGVEGLI